MERRDLIVDQIEQLSIALAKIIGKVLGLNSSEINNDKIETSNETLKTELDIDVELILLLSKQELSSYFAERNFKSDHFQLLSNYFEAIGSNKNKSENVVIYYQKAFDLLELADDIEKTLSFERISKKKRLQKLIETH